ncbi:hypothetical protein HHI_05365 [Hyphomonas hirschiana VP5]|nr:hypothetical protein HHI_05365 [Hyphomonas hirschiana VP5]
MMKAFSEKNTIIKATLLQGESGENEQVGIKHIAAGMMSAMRNPKGHEYDLMDSPDVCLDQLSIISALMRQIESAHGDIF